jgi:hypothetical protein
MFKKNALRFFSIYRVQILVFITLVITALIFLNTSENNDKRSKCRWGSTNGWIFYNLKGKVKSYTEKWYDFDDNPSQVGWLWKLDFDENGNKIHSEHYGNNTGDISLYTSNEHNDDNEITNSTTFDESGIVQTKTYYLYNQYGENYEERHYNISYDSREFLTQTFLTEFNEKHQPVKHKTLNSEGMVVYESEWFFDQLGNCVIQTSHSDRKKTSCIIEYDSEGNEIKCKFIDNVFTYRYEFDNKGNWIKKYCFKSEEQIPFSVEERAITYW